MTTTEGVKFVIEVDAQQAQAALTSVRAQTETLGGAMDIASSAMTSAQSVLAAVGNVAEKTAISIEHMARASHAVDNSLKKTEEAIGDYNVSLGDYDSHVKAFRRNSAEMKADLQGIENNLYATNATLLKSKDGFSGTTKSVGGFHGALNELDRQGPATEKALRSMQFAVGSLGSKASETAGVVGDFAGFLTAGGGWGLALATATIAATKFVDALDKISAANDAAFSKSWKAVDDIGKQTAMLREGTKRIYDEINPKTAAQEMAELGSQIEANQKKIESLQDSIFNQRRMRLLGPEKTEETKNQISQLIAQQDALTEAQYAIEARRRTQSQKNAAASSRGGTSQQADPLDAMMRDFNARIALEDKVQAEADKREQDARAANEKALSDIEANAERVRVKNYEDARHRETEAMQAAANRKAEIARAEAAAIAQIQTDAAMTGISILQGASQQFIADMISGQENATEAFMLSIAQQTGQALVGLGTRLVGESIVAALTPGLQPLSAAQAAAGVGLIAAGTAIGGISMGLSAKSGADGAKKDAASDPGVNTGKGIGKQSEGGGVNIVVNYGVSGPAAEDTARELARITREQKKRGI